MIKEMIRGGALLNLILICNEVLMGNKKLRGNVGCSDHKKVKSSIL